MQRLMGGLFVIATFTCGLTALTATPPAAGKHWVFFGTYTGGPGQGIFRSLFDPATGQLSPPELAGEARNASFLAVHPNGQFLYAVSEIDQLDGQRTGGVTAFSLNPRDGSLKLLNQQPSGGAGPCHLTVDRTGKFVLVANYGGGSASVLPIGADGQLKPPSDTVQHTGRSVNPQRQTAPHAHSVNLDAGNRFACVADLGLDQLLVYRLDAEHGKLVPHNPPFYATAPGAGPRHFTFHPDGQRAFVINELASTIDVLDFNPAEGKFTRKQTVSTLPADFKGNNTTAEVRVHPNGQFVYGSNRGHNSIAAFALDGTGHLKLIGHGQGGIKTPRNFNIDPTGQFLLVGSQDGDEVLVFRIDPATGGLEATKTKIAVKRPVCIVFHPRAE